MQYVKNYWPHILFTTLVVLFMFIYFIVYRTVDRVAWYDNMHHQGEELIQGIRQAIGATKY